MPRDKFHSPPRGEGEMLKRYLEQYPEFKFTIDTFGFGNEIAEDILLSFSDPTLGSFKHIPSSDMVGTIFINHIATQRSLITKNVSISIDPINSIPIGHIMGDYQIQKTEWGIRVNMISLKYGMTKTLLFKIELPEDLEEGTPLFDIKLRYMNRYSEIVENELFLQSQDSKLELNDISSYMQCYTVRELKNAMSNPNIREQLRIIADLITHIESCDISSFKEPL